MGGNQDWETCQPHHMIYKWYFSKTQDNYARMFESGNFKEWFCSVRYWKKKHSMLTDLLSRKRELLVRETSQTEPELKPKQYNNLARHTISNFKFHAAVNHQWTHTGSIDWLLVDWLQVRLWQVDNKFLQRIKAKIRSSVDLKNNTRKPKSLKKPRKFQCVKYE